MRMGLRAVLASRGKGISTAYRFVMV
jgi:hypothetical protein